MNCILAIDIGTTNCKAVVFDANGQVISSLKKGYETFSDDDGKSEQKPDDVFNVVLQLMGESFQKNQTIEAVSLSAAMHSLIAVDAQGKPLTNAIIWADTRSRRQAEALKKTEPGEIIYNKTGTPIHPMSPLCKIIWLRETMPDLFKTTHKFISIKEYLFYKLFNKYIIDYSIASATGLFDIKNLIWCQEALDVAGIQPNQLSTPVEVTHSETNLVNEYKNLSTKKELLPFIVGGNDGCLANLGSGVILPGDASLTIGTSGAVRMTTSDMKQEKAQRTFTYLLSKDIYITGGAINNGGITLEWLSKNVLNDATPTQPDELLHLAETVAAGADNLLFLPYLLGERAPMWDAAAKGVLFGITQQHTKAHFARAAVEGICFAMRDVMQAIEETNGEIKTIYASGGFTQSPFWLQMMADVLGKEIRVNKGADASATGAAILGIYALKKIDQLKDATRFFAIDKTFYPNETVHKIYTSLFVIFQSLYPKLKDAFAALDKLKK